MCLSFQLQLGGKKKKKKKKIILDHSTGEVKPAGSVDQPPLTTTSGEGATEAGVGAGLEAKKTDGQSQQLVMEVML